MTFSGPRAIDASVGVGVATGLLDPPPPHAVSQSAIGVITTPTRQRSAGNFNVVIVTGSLEKIRLTATYNVRRTKRMTLIAAGPKALCAREVDLLHTFDSAPDLLHAARRSGRVRPKQEPLVPSDCVRRMRRACSRLGLLTVRLET